MACATTCCVHLLIWLSGSVSSSVTINFKLLFAPADDGGQASLPVSTARLFAIGSRVRNLNLSILKRFEDKIPLRRNIAIFTYMIGETEVGWK
jgi:hypothetical protein